MKFCLSLLTSLLILPWIAVAGEVTIDIIGLESNKGKAIVGVYANPDRFLEDDGALQIDCPTEKIKDLKTSATCNLKPGTYAIAVFHDENNNDELDSNFIGIPKESVGFSQNPSFSFGPPDFEEADFKLADDKIHLTVKMKKF